MSDITFTPVITKLRQKGKIVYEYNPFKNLRIVKTPTHYYSKQSNTYLPADSEHPATHYLDAQTGNYKKPTNGEIANFDTELLNFDLEHPVEIECLQSYDGSVNLILDDGLNPTRLINSRFTVKQNNTYEIIDRTGNADTNLYDQDLFDLDTSLYKKINTIPKVNFLGLLPGGNLPIGNYNFYFKYADADGNETDFIAESGNVVCHIGNINDPYSIRSGLENENSGKIVLFSITNLDASYDFIKVYYSRQTSSAHNEPMSEYKQLIKTFKTRGLACLINITGFEETIPSTLEEINKEYFLANSAKSIALCKNRLFLANLTKPSLDYLDFLDISLRMLPYYTKEASFKMNHNYQANSDRDYGYYNALNIYNKVGYWNEEIYRIGVVYILSDNTLSPVFNIRGCDGIPNNSAENYYYEGKSEAINKLFVYENGNKTNSRDYLLYDEETCLIENGISDLENIKGVIRIKDSNYGNEIYSIGIYINQDIIDYLKNKLKIKGLFFVRQKRIPTILTQAFVIGHDLVSGIPLIPYENKYLFESFVDKGGTLTQDYTSRLVSANTSMCNNEVAICPDYSIRLEMYNNFFTDTDFTIKKIAKYNLIREISNDRHYYTDEGVWVGENNTSNFKINPIIGVPDSIQLKRTRDSKFVAKAGSAESYDFTTVGYEFELDYEDPPKNKECIVRGNYSSFLGISNYKGDAGDLINIYIPNYSVDRMSEYFTIRYEDLTPYYAISDRLDLLNLKNTITLYRGDCYICQYTHRLNRNFLDLTAPTNDEIVDEDNWFYNYRPDSDPGKLTDLNIGDLNAVQLGSWITLTVRSNMNLSMRDEDSSNISENLITGNNRSFFPLTEISTDGNYKIPESSIINTGISSQVSQRINFIQPEVPYLKNCYQTRIAYSDLAITDAYKNGYRTFLAGSYRDYPTTYGGIMKILEVKNSLLVVFEHGIGLAPVNERIMAGGGSGGSVSINTGNVLPETLNMITTDYGTLWPDSILLTPHGVYGVDTIAKKIWIYKGNSIELLSDDLLQRFLNDNISLTETELTPTIGVRNVKTNYNAFKKDVMFTFYDCLDGYDETAWNLCYNEYSGTFTTFYSWIPSFSTNIDNICFTFDRDTSKKIAKLDTSKKNGICVANTVLPDTHISQYLKLHLDIVLPTNYIIEWFIEPTLFKSENSFILLNSESNYGNRQYKNVNYVELKYDKTKGVPILQEHQIIPLNIKAIVYELSQPPTLYNDIPSLATVWGIYKKQLYFTSKEYLGLSEGLTDDLKLTTNFWKHGYSGIIDSSEKLKPCHWYGKQHPFEFEYVVNVSPDELKTFDSMLILSNNVAPESFHYEIVGDTYDFALDKLNMYVRLELTKELYQLNGSDIKFNSNYKDLLSEITQRNTYYIDKTKANYNDWKQLSPYKDKSTLLPLYYTRVDTFDELYDEYVKMTSLNGSKNYSNLSGGEITYDPILKLFGIVNHVQGIDMKDPIQGRLRGNMLYLNDKWHVQINPLNFVQKNETDWGNYVGIDGKIYNKIPLNVYYPKLINDITSISLDRVPNNTYNIITTDNWGNRKEVKIKDKYMKVKIRYSGDKLALITGVRTIFRI